MNIGHQPLLSTFPFHQEKKTFGVFPSTELAAHQGSHMLTEVGDSSSQNSNPVMCCEAGVV